MKKLTFILLAMIVALGAIAQPPRPNGRPMKEPPRHEEKRGYYGPEFKAASPEQVNAIVRYIKTISFDKEKLEAAKLCAMLCPIRVVDLSRIAELFSFDDSRVDFLIYAYRYCPDPQYYPMLKDCFSFTTSYDKLLNSIGYWEEHRR